MSTNNIGFHREKKNYPRPLLSGAMIELSETLENANKSVTVTMMIMMMGCIKI